MKRIPFVDDDANVLAGLRNSLRSRRTEWNCIFVLGPELALKELEGEPYTNTNPVNSRCEHFQMKDTAGGKEDIYELYTVAKVADYQAIYGEECGGGWQMYWRQSIPGYRNSAKDLSGKPMKNWWPFLFY